MKGTAACNVENALAAATALLGLNIHENQIHQGLTSFRPDGEDNPGRFNIFQVGSSKVMLDYGHNIAGYSQVIEFLKKQEAARLVGVIGVPGDRQDEAVKKVGALCGRHFQKLIIKEDADLRGRKPGEIAELLKQAAQNSGNPQLELEVCLSEEDALAKAVSTAQPGDFIAVFYEEYEPLKNMIMAQHQGKALQV
jgi:cyanophycin synthetase